MSNEIQQWQDEQSLIQQLRARGDVVSLQKADQLQKLFHDRQMDALSQDVYQAANGEGHSPLGWTRLSEHPELVRDFARKLQLSEVVLKQRLRPDESGFRAEVYIPDPRILGPGFKPSVAFKGSSGEVMASDGKHHDTTIEDFLGNNFAQSVGLETDYYDRAMGLAAALKLNKVDVEFTGHSLAGGMASAASAVTGYFATTFNSAGLHPLTAKRFADQNNIPVYDASQLVTAYQVKGELLNDGVQANLRNMDTIERAQLAIVLKETSDLLTRLPDARHRVDTFMQQAHLPPQARQSTLAFMDKVAYGHADQLLRDLPQSVGQVHMLDAMTRDAQGNLVPRDATMSLPELMARLGPVMDVLAAASLGARAGDAVGTVASLPQQWEGSLLHSAGSHARSAGELNGEALQIRAQLDGEMQRQTEHLGVAAAAHARVMAAELGAQLDQDVGHAREFGASVDAAALRGVGHVMPHEAQQWLHAQADAMERAGQHAAEQGRTQALADRLAGDHEAAALRRAGLTAEHATMAFANDYGRDRHDASAQSGQWVGRQLDSAGNTVQRVGELQHEVFTAAGATVTSLSVAALPAEQARLIGATQAVQQAIPSGGEALNRHLMSATVTPSMDHYIQQQEAVARDHFQRAPAMQREAHATITHEDKAAVKERQHATAELSQPLPVFADPGHPQHALYELFKRDMPVGTSEERLMQATAACHMAKISTPKDLCEVHICADNVFFLPASLHAMPASIDLLQPAPSVQQTMQQTQAYDQQQAQCMAQIHERQQQHAQAHAQQGPVLGGPPMHYR
jgi:hypothetical protein